jgi:hypothetical protein
MNFNALQELESEYNAGFDYIREAYAATQLDPDYEGYCDYCNDCDQTGEEPISFEAYRASLRTFVPAAPFRASYATDDEIPF